MYKICACYVIYSSHALCPRRTYMGFIVARSARGVRIWDLSSRALCPPRTSTRFRITHQALGVRVWDLESLFRRALPWQRDLYMYVHVYTEVCIALLYSPGLLDTLSFMRMNSI